MANQKIAIGLVLRTIAKEKKIGATEIADKLGMTRQAVYDTYGKRITMSIDEVERWAEILGVTAKEIVDRRDGIESPSGKSNESIAFSTEVAARIEDHFRKIEEFYMEQLKAKDQQIEKLLGLLGKSKGVPAGRIVPLEPCEISEAA